jgi:hypothetical protein
MGLVDRLQIFPEFTVAERVLDKTEGPFMQISTISFGAKLTYQIVAFRYEGLSHESFQGQKPEERLNEANFQGSTGMNADSMFLESLPHRHIKVEVSASVSCRNMPQPQKIRKVAHNAL